MQWLIERARDEGGEAWIRQCLDLPRSSGQEALVRATTAAEETWISAAEVELTTAETSIWEPAPQQEEEQEDLQEEVPCRRRRRRRQACPGECSSEEEARPAPKTLPLSASFVREQKEGMIFSRSRPSLEVELEVWPTSVNIGSRSVAQNSAVDTAGGRNRGGSASVARGGATTQRPFPTAEESPWQQRSQSDARAGMVSMAASGSAPLIQDTGLASPAPYTQQQGAGESSSLSVLSNIAELLAELAKDMQPAASQAQAMPHYADQSNDRSVMGVWSPSSGKSANDIQTA